jgi:hypothetical protein
MMNLEKETMLTTVNIVVSAAAIIWGLIVARMALRKQHKPFRLALISR